MMEHSTTETARIGELERQSAVQSSDIRGILGALDEIRDVLVRMQENAKPNLTAMVFVVLATCTFLVTIGGLVVAPMYRGLDRTSMTVRSLDEAMHGSDAKLEQRLYENHGRLSTIEGMLFRDYLEKIR